MDPGDGGNSKNVANLEAAEVANWVVLCGSWISRHVRELTCPWTADSMVNFGRVGIFSQTEQFSECGFSGSFMVSFMVCFRLRTGGTVQTV